MIEVILLLGRVALVVWLYRFCYRVIRSMLEEL